MRRAGDRSFGLCGVIDPAPGHGPNCLVYVPNSYNGRGPPEACASLLPGFAEAGFSVTAYLPRVLQPFSRNVTVVETLRGPVRRLPFRLSGPIARRSMEKAFIRALERCDPARTVAYFWPDVPLTVIRAARARGVLTVREMINNPVVIARSILDAAYRRAGSPIRHGITEAKVRHEAVELPLYDRFFTSNDQLIENMQRVGIAADKIIATSFGWRAGRFQTASEEPSQPDAHPLRVLYVGTLEIRKGTPELLEAWRRSGLAGTLVLAGAIAPELRELVAHHVGLGDVEHLGFVEDVADLYRSADLFAFPSHEEGGPQVTIEAGRCGLPIIATLMGAARFVEEGVNGLIVPPGDVDALAAALRRLGSDAVLRKKMSAASALKGRDLEYAAVGARRAAALIAALEVRNGSHGGG